jgi:hypothetical protein
VLPKRLGRRQRALLVKLMLAEDELARAFRAEVDSVIPEAAAEAEERRRAQRERSQFPKRQRAVG